MHKQGNEVGPALGVYVYEQILQRLEEDPKISSKRLAAAIEVSKTKVLQAFPKK